MTRTIPRIFATAAFLAAVVFSCRQTTGPRVMTGSLHGTVRKGPEGTAPAIPSASVFEGDSLVATADGLGVFAISAMTEGIHALTCTALYCRDTTVQVSILGGRTTVQDFVLIPDSSVVKVYGEFQDLDLFNQRVSENPQLATWDSKQIVDGTTGATLQNKTLQVEVPDRIVSLGDSVVALSDGFGQFWFRIPCGAHRLKGSCEGYRSVTRVVKVRSDRTPYVTFLLPRAK